MLLLLLVFDMHFAVCQSACSLYPTHKEPFLFCQSFWGFRESRQQHQKNKTNPMGKGELFVISRWRMAINFFPFLFKAGKFEEEEKKANLIWNIKPCCQIAWREREIEKKKSFQSGLHFASLLDGLVKKERDPFPPPHVVFVPATPPLPRSCSSLFRLIGLFFPSSLFFLSLPSNIIINDSFVFFSSFISIKGTRE